MVSLRAPTTRLRASDLELLGAYAAGLVRVQPGEDLLLDYTMLCYAMLCYAMRARAVLAEAAEAPAGRHARNPQASFIWLGYYPDN